MPAEDTDKKTMDVALPGKTAPDASARPVIVTHRPMVQDPMVKNEAASDMVDADKSEVKSKTTVGSKVVEPLTDMSDVQEPSPDSTDTSETSETSEAAEASKDDKSAQETATAKPPETEPPKTAKDDTDTDAKPESSPKKPTQSDSDSAAVEAVAEQVGSGKKKDEKSQQEAAQQTHIAKLIEDKKYFVKTGQVARRRKNRIAIVFLVLLLIAVGLYLAVDAGVLKPGVDVPIHFIQK